MRVPAPMRSVLHPQLPSPDESELASLGPSGDESELPPSPFGPKVRSLRVPRPTAVVSAPNGDGELLGTIGGGQRVAFRSVQDGPGCRVPWIEVEPRGWICAAVEPTHRPANAEMLPRVPKGGLIPGKFGRVAEGARAYKSQLEAMHATGGRKLGGSVKVRRLGTVSLGKRKFWRTPKGLIDTKDIQREKPSRFRGIDLEAEGAPELPFAWTLRQPGSKRMTVPVFAEPTRGAKVIRRLGARKIVPVGEVSDDGEFVQVGAKGWVHRGDLRLALPSGLPPGANEGERWLDINLDQQVLVAYEGAKPVFATLISTGRIYYRTPPGVYRITRKQAERTMNSARTAKEQYSVADVPWTSYFADGFAIHASYWHGSFGYPKSHGCINLSPIDAKFVYEWTAPHVAPGWSEAYGSEGQPGSLVQIRSLRVQEPALKGYAATMLAQR